MPRPLMNESDDHSSINGFVPDGSRKRYLVVRRQDDWLIAFDGEEFGPYRSESEAMLFAIDAAHQLGERGEPTVVLRVHEDGTATAVWRSGLDLYPPGP